MSINLTDELLAKTKKGKIASAKQVFLEGDQENLQQISDKTHQLEDAIKDITVTGGASTANAVSFNNETSGMTAVTAQGAIDELAAKNATKAEKTEVTAELEKKFDKESILQESGDAEDKVMSQKAVSDKLSDLFRIVSQFEMDYGNISIIGTIGSNRYVSIKSGLKFKEGVKYNITATLPIQSKNTVVKFLDGENLIESFSIVAGDTSYNYVYTAQKDYVAEIQVALFGGTTSDNITLKIENTTLSNQITDIKNKLASISDNMDMMDGSIKKIGITNGGSTYYAPIGQGYNKSVIAKDIMFCEGHKFVIESSLQSQSFDTTVYIQDKENQVIESYKISSGSTSDTHEWTPRKTFKGNILASMFGGSPIGKINCVVSDKYYSQSIVDNTVKVDNLLSDNLAQYIQTSIGKNAYITAISNIEIRKDCKYKVKAILSDIQEKDVTISVKNANDTTIESFIIKAGDRTSEHIWTSSYNYKVKIATSIWGVNPIGTIGIYFSELAVQDTKEKVNDFGVSKKLKEYLIENMMMNGEVVTPINNTFALIGGVDITDEGKAYCAICASDVSKSESVNKPLYAELVIFDLVAPQKTATTKVAMRKDDNYPSVGTIELCYDSYCKVIDGNVVFVNNATISTKGRCLIAKKYNIATGTWDADALQCTLDINGSSYDITTNNIDNILSASNIEQFDYTDGGTYGTILVNGNPIKVKEYYYVSMSLGHYSHALVKSKDLIHYEFVCDIPVNVASDEVTLMYYNNYIYAAARVDKVLNQSSRVLRLNLTSLEWDKTLIFPDNSYQERLAIGCKQENIVVFGYCNDVWEQVEGVTLARNSKRMYILDENLNVKKTYDLNFQRTAVYCLLYKFAGNLYLFANCDLRGFAYNFPIINSELTGDTSDGRNGVMFSYFDSRLL